MHRLALIVVLGLLIGCAPKFLTLRKLMLAPIGDVGEISFAEVAARIERVAEALCRERAQVRNCDFRVVIDLRPEPMPNAFQTVDRAGRPILGFNAAQIALARNPDELAFVMGHEAAHHIKGHIPQREQAALTGAVLGAIFAAEQGLPEPDVERAGQIGGE